VDFCIVVFDPVDTVMCRFTHAGLVVRVSAT